MENLHVYMGMHGEREREAIKFMENTHAIFILNSHVVFSVSRRVFPFEFMEPGP
jgi:hypothetical protein